MSDPTTADLHIAAMQERDKIAARLADARADLARITAQRDDAIAAARKASDRLREAEVIALRVDDLEVRLREVLARQQELLAAIDRLTNKVPYREEIAGWMAQRASLISEIGTLRARVSELERDGSATVQTPEHEFASGCVTEIPPVKFRDASAIGGEIGPDFDRIAGLVEVAVGAEPAVPEPISDPVASSISGVARSRP